MGQGRAREIQPDELHFGNLHVVAPDDWYHPSDPEKEERHRTGILRQMWGENTGYPAEFYATKDSFRDDAVACFRRHGEPGLDHGPAGCGDYESDAKRLTDSEWLQRQEFQERVMPGAARKHVYLCHFCPFQTVVTTKIRQQRGDYE
jgi:hypothetical protein